MSVRTWVKQIAVIGALALGATGASAATVTFDLTGGPDRASTMTFTQGALSLLVSANRFTNAGVISAGGKVTQTSAGLGERSGRNDDTAKLDGEGANELLMFAFSSKVLLKGVTFTQINPGSEGVGFLDGAKVGTGAILSFVDLANFLIKTDNFGIGAAKSDSAFRISSITVATVPLPAGGALLLSALALPLLRRKRRS